MTLPNTGWCFPHVVPAAFVRFHRTKEMSTFNFLHFVTEFHDAIPILLVEASEDDDVLQDMPKLSN